MGKSKKTITSLTFADSAPKRIVMEIEKSARNHYKPFPVASAPNRIVMEIAKTTRNHSKLVGRESNPKRFPPREIRSQKVSEEATAKNLKKTKKTLDLTVYCNDRMLSQGGIRYDNQGVFTALRLYCADTAVLRQHQSAQAGRNRPLTPADLGRPNPAPQAQEANHEGPVLNLGV